MFKNAGLERGFCEKTAAQAGVKMKGETTTVVLSTPTKEQKREIDKIKKALDRNKDGAVSNTINNYVN